MRNRLLDAAAEIFLARGYNQASMEQVRQLAGASNGSLYHHFPTKAQLADALYVDTLSDFHASIFAVIAREVDVETGVKGMVRAYVHWVVKHPGRAALLDTLRRDGEVTEASAGVNAENLKMFAALKDWVRRQSDAGGMRAYPFPVWVQLVFAPAFALTRHWVRQAQPSVPAKVRAALEHAAWMSVAP